MTHYTKWHRMIECLDAERVDPVQSQSASIKEMIRSENVQKIINDDIPVFKLPLRHDFKDNHDEWREMKKTLDEYVVLSDAMKEALQPPFDEFVVESELYNPLLCESDVQFTHLRHFGNGCFAATKFFMVDDFVVVETVNHPLVLREANVNVAEKIDFGPFQVIPDFVFPSGRSFHQSMVSLMIFDITRLMILLHTKGIVQDRMEAPKFTNKQRVKKGKPPIPTVIHLRPGYYYDQAGDRHECDERKPVCIHWRRGHMRNVWCGTGDERHREPRYIAPCLVNYDGGEQPEHKVRVLH